MRFAKHGLGYSGDVYLRFELVSRAKDLCVVDGPLSVQLVRVDGEVAQADPRGSASRYRTLPGPGTVQWFRVDWTRTQAYCTLRPVPVRELRVRFPSDGGERVIPASALPAPGRTYCPDTFPRLLEEPDAGLDGP